MRVNLVGRMGGLSLISIEFVGVWSVIDSDEFNMCAGFVSVKMWLTFHYKLLQDWTNSSTPGSWSV